MQRLLNFINEIIAQKQSQAEHAIQMQLQAAEYARQMLLHAEFLKLESQVRRLMEQARALGMQLEYVGRNLARPPHLNPGDFFFILIWFKLLDEKHF